MRANFSEKEALAAMDRLLDYLTRTHQGEIVAAEEEQMAAQIIVSLQKKIFHLEQALLKEHREPVFSEHSCFLGTVAAPTADDISMLCMELERLQAEQKKDEQRMAFILQEGITASGESLCVPDSLMRSEVYEGDYRAAIDRLMER